MPNFILKPKTNIRVSTLERVKTSQKGDAGKSPVVHFLPVQLPPAPRIQAALWGAPTFRQPRFAPRLEASSPTFPFCNLSNNMSIEMAVIPMDVRPPKRQRTSDASTSGLQCQVCHRSYERADHLNRHLDSREHPLRLINVSFNVEFCTDRNERSYRCGECPAAFNRRDLLLRHQATHAKNAADGLVGPNRAAERATKACNSCVVSKVKCDNSRPCKRCQKKSFTCLTKPSDFLSFPKESAEEQPPQMFTALPGQQDNRTNFESDIQINSAYLEEPNADAQALLDLYNTTGYNQHTIPAFFEQIMVPAPDFMGADYMQSPPDLTAWMPEVDWLGQADIFGSDFTPTINQMLEAQVMQEVSLLPQANETNAAETSNEKSENNSAKRRHAVFKQSPW